MNHRVRLCLCALLAAPVPACGYGGMFFADLGQRSAVVSDESCEIGTGVDETWSNVLSVLRKNDFVVDDGAAVSAQHGAVVFSRTGDASHDWVAVSVAAGDGGGSRLSLLVSGDHGIYEQIVAACGATSKAH